jgi:hypothetical protein
MKRSLVLGLVLLAFVLFACQTTPNPVEGLTPKASNIMLASPTAVATQVPMTSVTVFFTDVGRYSDGTPPFEAPVSRQVQANQSLPQAVLREFFLGPSEEEKAAGLELVASGFTGLQSLTITDGIARVYLIGSCHSNGATYTVAAPILANLLQFPEISYVKIYDAEGNTEQPEGLVNSIPFCLEP